MINNVIWKDTIFSGTEDYLEYRISKNAVTPIYYGKAFRSPSTGRYEINISDKARSFLKPHISSSAWTTVDGVYETEDFAATFAIQDLANSAVSLEQFYLQYTTAEDFIGGAKITARPINGHIDPRMKMMWAKWDYMTRNVPVDKGYKYFDINIVSGSLDYEFSGGTNTVVFEATGPDYTITADDDWIHITGGDGTYEITADVNTGETRTGYVCAQWYNAQFQLEEKCFEVTQGEEVFEFTYEGNTSFSYTGGTNVLSFTANTEIEIIYAPTWITSATVSGGETGTITLTATGNSFDARIGTIRVRRKNYSSGHTAEIVVTQERVQLELTFSGDTVFEYSGGTINVAYTANTQFQTLVIPAWINSVQVPSTLTGNIQITAAPNEGEERSGSIIFYDGVDSSHTFTLGISQKEDIPVYEDMYLSIQALSAGTLELKNTLSARQDTLEYSIDDGAWNTLPASASTSVTIGIGSVVKFKHTYYATYTSTRYCINVKPKYQCNIYGNLLSLVYGDNFKNYSNLGDGHRLNSLFMGSDVVSSKNIIFPQNTIPYCYSSMFASCALLTEAPKSLPATTLTRQCYASMFQYCSSLNTVPSISGVNLDYRCCEYMFANCTSLTVTPELPAVVMGQGSYHNMFSDCTSLVTAPTLPATTLAPSCYTDMFIGCTSLVNAPALPATALTGNCYYSMFQGCTSLVNAPVLPATEGYAGCYNTMFKGCSSLKYIKCLLGYVSTYDSDKPTYGWVNGVSSTGTFVKKAGVTWPSGTDGIPNGWTVIEE